MSTITYIRHGQASLFKEDYDNLSELGWQQAELLGQYMAEHNFQVDQIFVGPLKRHAQTLEGIRKGFASKGTLPTNPVILEGLKEHKLPEILRAVKPALIETNEEIKAMAAVSTPTEKEKIKEHFRMFEKVFLMWANEEIDDLYSGYHTFKEFRATALAALEKIKSETKKGESTIVVTSGGPVGASVGDTLLLSIKKMCEISWEVYNASMTSYKLTKNNFRLTEFNAIPHLTDPQMRTLV